MGPRERRGRGRAGTDRSAAQVLEKLFYVYTWVRFLRTGGLGGVADPMLSLFLATYGAWDFICAVGIFLPAALL